MISGTVRFTDGALDNLVTNTITINGGAVSSFDGGNQYTNNNIVVNGSRFFLPILGEIFVGGGIGYYQNILPNSIDVIGIVGTDPVDLSLSLDQENWILANVFVAQDLNLGASNDNVTFNSYAQVLNINLGAGDDKLKLNEEAIVRGDINLGSGQNTLIFNCGNVFNGRVIANEGTNVIVAGTSMTLNGDFLSLGSTNNVLVVANGALLHLSGVSIGRFLAVSENQGIYLNQNAVVELTQVTPGTFIQSYTGNLTVAGDVNVLAAPTAIPAQVAEYYTTPVTDGVVASQITATGGFTLATGAKLTGSTVNVDLDVELNGVVTDSTISNFNTEESDFFDINGTVTNSILESDNDLSVNVGATVTNSSIEVDDDAYIDGTVTGGILDAGEDVFVDGLITGTTMYVDEDLDIDGTVTDAIIDVDGAATITGAVVNSTLTASDVVFEADDAQDLTVASFTGKIFAENSVEFNESGFFSPELVISTTIIDLEEGVLVTIGSTDATQFGFDNNAILIETGTVSPLKAATITIGDTTNNLDFSILPFAGIANISIRGFVTGDLTLSSNIVSLDADGFGNFGDFVGKLILNGDNRLVVKSDIWYDWQQFVFNSGATLGFDLSESVLLAIDGFIGSDPLTTIVNVTNFGQNSQLAIGSWVYINNWKDMGDSTRSYELPVNNFQQGNVNNLAWDNLYVIAGSEIWGGIRLNDNANELVINDGVVVNGSNYFYDYGTIRTLAGDDTVTIGAATIYGRINTGDGADMMTLNGTVVSAAVNQGDPAIEMGIGNDTLAIASASIVTGDISLGDGNDAATITDSTITGNIDTGAGNDTLIIDPSTITGDISLGGGDDIAAIIASTVTGDIDLGAGTDEVTISASTVTGNVLGVDNNTLVIEAASTLNGAVILGAGDDDVTISASTINGVVLDEGSPLTAISLGIGTNELTLNDAEIIGEVELGDFTTDGKITNMNTVSIGTDSAIHGDLEFGQGLTVVNTLVAGDATVEGDVSFGWIDATDPLAPIKYAAQTNTVEVIGDFKVDGDVVMLGLDNEVTLDEDATLTVGGDILMTDLNTNAIATHYYDTNDEQSITVAAINNTIVADAIAMDGSDNSVQFGVLALSDSEYAKGFHRPSSITLDTVAMTLNAPITMDDDAGIVTNNTMDMDFGLASLGDSSIVAKGAAAITVNGAVSMTSGIANEIYFSVWAQSIGMVYDSIPPVGFGHSSIELNAVSMMFNAPTIVLANDVGVAENIIDMEYSLAAAGGSDILANGTVTTTLNSKLVNMTGVDNEIYFGIEVAAINSVSATPPLGWYGPASVALSAATMTLTGDINMTSDVLGTGALNDLDMDHDFIALGDSSIVAKGPLTTILNSDVSMTGKDNEIYFGIDVEADGEYDTTNELYKHASITLGAETKTLTGSIIMDNNVEGRGATNLLDASYNLDTDADSNIAATGSVAIALNTGILGVSMVGEENVILLDVDAHANGEYDTKNELHKQSLIEIGAINIGLTGGINMINDISDPDLLPGGAENVLIMNYDLDAEGEGDIVVSGDAAVSVKGNVNMLGTDNYLSAQVRFNADAQSVINLNKHNVNLLIDGNVTMTTLGDAANTMDLGYSWSPVPVVPVDPEQGVVNATGSYTVKVDGEIVMAGVDATNTLTIEKNVTVTGAISMGKVLGDDLSALNILNLTDPGSFTGTTITMIAVANKATLSGSGLLSEKLNIYGGENELTVGADVKVNDVVSFGGIYDKDAIGTEGYVILKNLTNTINVFGIVNGINTAIDLNAPVGVVNDSKDTITITGSSLGVVNVVNNIITGNGDDSIDIQGGNVGGDVTMGDRASGAVGKNRIRVAALKIPATLTTPELLIPASVGGNVNMESTTFNRIDVRGLFQENTDGSHTATSARIGGKATMNALTYDANGNLDESIGENRLTMEETSTITGAVAMAAGKSNTMTVTTGEIDTYVGGPVGGTQQDSIAKVGSIAMISAANSLSVDKGLLGTAEGTLNVTSVIAGTTNGISMTQDQAHRFSDPLATYTNTITVEEAGRLVLTSTSDILMGNTVNEAVLGTYTFDKVTLNPSHIEVYYFNWNGGTNENVYDTTLNTITVHGRMFADDVTMYAKTNVMKVDGGAGIINPAGEGAFDGGNITMQGGLLVGGGVLASESNTLTDTALFFSNKIDMYATSFNDLQITGESGVVPVPVGGYRSKVVGNVTMGTAAQVLVPAETGDNKALFVSTDVTGNIDMEALGARGNNSLKLTDSTVSGGVTTNAVAGSNTVNIDPSSVGSFVNMDALTDNHLFVTGEQILPENGTLLEPDTVNLIAADVNPSTIGTTVNMDAISGRNHAHIDIGSVGGAFSMITAAKDGLENELNVDGSYIKNLPVGVLAGHDVLVSPARVDESSIGALTMTSGTSYNSATFDIANVSGSVGMTAATNNTLSLTGVVIPEILSSTDLGVVLQPKQVVTSDITGSVTMTATAGDNLLNLAVATVGNGVTMTAADTFTSTVNVDANSSITGGITLNGAADGVLDINGTVNGNILTASGDDSVTVGGIVNGSVTTGAGNDTMILNGTAGNIDMGANDDKLTLNVGNANVGLIDMGAGTNTVDISAAFDLSDITSTAGDLTIGGTSTAFTVSSNLGVAGQTTSVTAAAATLTFATSGNTVKGTLNTTASANIFDASAIANGGTLINASGATVWDVLEVGDVDMKVIGNAAFVSGNEVNLATGYAVDLTDWNTAGIANVTLNISGTDYSLAWNAINLDYEGAVGADTWKLTDAGNTKLVLGIA